MVTDNLINALSDIEIAQIEAEIQNLPDRQSAAIDAMKIVQQHRGWVSDASIDAIAKLLQMSIEQLDGIATFYSLIYRQPVGEKVILLCDSVTCWIMGGDKICKKIQSHLNITFGETTQDAQYTLLPITCLGDCDHAPAMMVADVLHHDLNESEIEAILK